MFRTNKGCYLFFPQIFHTFLIMYVGNEKKSNSGYVEFTSHIGEKMVTRLLCFDVIADFSLKNTPTTQIASE
jgi:hypothetical protein